jgi:hypothetical protein
MHEKTAPGNLLHDQPSIGPTSPIKDEQCRAIEFLVIDSRESIPTTTCHAPMSSVFALPVKKARRSRDQNVTG